MDALLHDLRAGLAMVTESSVTADRHEVSAAPFQDWRAQSRSFERLSGYVWWTTNLTGVQAPEHLLGYRITPDLFDTLGVRPALGRATRVDPAIALRAE